MKVYRAVLADLFDTLLYCRGTGTREMAIEVAVEAGLSPEDWIRGWRMSFEYAARGALTSMLQRVRFALGAAGLQNPDPQLADRMAGLLAARDTAHLYFDTRSALRNLRERGYLLGLVSNIASDEKGIISALHLDQCFDVLLLSCEAGLLKPAPGIYLLAAGRLSVEPHECVFVDDRPSFVAAAQAVGMTGVRIDRPEADAEESCDATVDVQITSLAELLTWLPKRAGNKR